MRRHATRGLAVLLSAIVTAASIDALAAGGAKGADAGATAAAPAAGASTAGDAGAAASAPASAGIAAAPTPADGGAGAAPTNPAGPSTTADVKPAMDGATYAVRLRDLEARVDELKDQIRRSHTRLALLSDTILSGGAAGSRSEVGFQNEMSSAFRLTRALFVIDGTVQYNRQDETGALADQKEIPIFSGSVPPGDHTVQVLLNFQGNGYGVFTYLRGYKFEVKSSHSFTAVEGKTLTLTATALEKGGVTTPLEQRPSIEWHEKVQSIGAGSPSGTSAPAPGAPAASGGASGAVNAGGTSAGGNVSIGGGDQVNRSPRFGRGRTKHRLKTSGSRVELAGAARVATGLLSCAFVSFASFAFPREAFAANSDDHANSASVEIVSVDRESAAVQAAVDKAKSVGLTVEERLANGELLYRTKDYARAALVFSEILEKYPNTPSYPDALWLRGETYYASHEYLSARRDYRQLVERGSEGRFQSYFGKSLARLVDVSLRIGDVAALDEVFQKLGQVPPAQVDAGLNYAKGKAYYVRQDYSMATQSFAAVPPGTPYSHQAKYFQGLIAMKQVRGTVPKAPPAGTTPSASTSTTAAASANYKSAIEIFKQATEMPPDTDEHRHVIDLSWMAIGRLFYEMEQYTQASEAYAKVGRESPEFDTMLYELAWVYVRLGDVQRAERALEVLSVADPSSPYVGDGTLLRADLLLRAGAFDKALQLYEGVRGQYDPMRAKVETFLDSTKDVAVYYDKLSQQQLDALDQNEQLPPLAIRWAREAEDGPAAFAVIDDVNQCKTLIKQSQILIDKLTALTGAANRVRAFPELLAGEERALGLINRIARARVELAQGLDQEESSEVSGEMATVRNQRRALMNVVSAMPTNSSEFNDREQAGMKQWNTVSQELTRRSLEVDQLQATVNGLRRMLKEDPQHGVTRDPASVQRFSAELDQNEHDLKLYQTQVGELRRQIEFGRAQIGLGDARYQNDAVARMQFRDLLDREVQLASAGQAGNNGQRYAARVGPLLLQARAEDDKLLTAFAALEVQVAARTTELQQKIETERRNITGYAAQLDVLENGDGGSRDLVGHVAEKNFMMVRDKLRGIVLRADVGITEQAWEVREEELARVQNLQTERAREEQLLDEELREVLDDANEPGKP